MELYFSTVLTVSGLAAMGAPLLPKRVVNKRPVVNRGAFNHVGHNLRRAYPVVSEND